MQLEPHRQSFDPADGQPGILRRLDATCGFANQTQALEKLFIVRSQRTTYGRVMTLDVLSGGEHAYVGAKLEHRLQHRRKESVIHRETHTVPASNRCNRW